MSAETLWAAADRLEELAGRATPGPWESGLTGVYQPEGMYVARWEDDSQTPITVDRMYIAAMHPEVGKALAAWLRWDAHMSEAMHAEVEEPALDLARLILGGDQ